MKFLATVTAVAAVAGSVAFAQDMTVGVSWSNFQEERWKTDEAAILGALDAAGAGYVSTDAQSSSAKQLSDVESLIARASMRSSSWRRTARPSAPRCRPPPTRAFRSSPMTA